MMKKGQVTIFVILGLIVLLGASLFFFVNKTVSDNKPGLDVPDVSLEARPAIELVNRCLLSTAEKGFRELGNQGGTFNPPKVSYPSYRGKSVLFEPDVIPFWRYLDSCKNPSGCEEIFEPGLCIPGNKYCNGLPTSDDSIQKNIQDYIDSHIGSCIDKFSSIGKQYNITINGKPKSEVIFKEGSTVLLLNYPITITSMSTGNVQKVDSFRVDLDLDFYKIYKLANEILNFERKSNYFEKETMDLVNVYADVNNPVLPPTDSVEFFNNGAGPWIQQEIHDTLQNDLLPLIGLVHFANVHNNYPILSNVSGAYSAYANGFYRSLLPKTSNTIYPDLNVNVDYLYSPIYSKVGDGSAILKGSPIVNLQPDLLKNFLRIFMKDYRFPYDISYPLVITISDPTAFKGRGYDFQFALEVNVRNNLPGYNNFTLVSAPSSNQVDPEVLKLPNVVSVKTFDKLTGKPLSGVRISYICGPEFDIGSTEKTSSGSAVLNAKFPYCAFGGYIRYRKDGYFGSSIPFNNVNSSGNVSFDIKLWPLKRHEIIVRKRTLSDIKEIEDTGSSGMWFYDSAYSNLSSSDEVLLNLNKKQDSPYEDSVPLLSFLRYVSSNFSSSSNSFDSLKSALDEGLKSGFYSQEEYDSLLSDLKNSSSNTSSSVGSSKYYFDLAPGDYALDATLLDNSGLYLPNETVDFNENASWIEKVVFPKSSKFDFPEENFSTWILGGSELNFTLSPAQVYQDKPIVFYVIEQNKPRNWTSFLSQEDWTSLEKKYAALLRPKI